MVYPDWLDDTEYPFKPHFFDTGIGKMHYVDEGNGKPVVFLHGNPDWSFSYRNVIQSLSPDYRCLAPDYLGFGLSDKPFPYDYKPWDMASHLEKWLKHLALPPVTLVMNDWGGPIGLDLAIRNPEKVENLVVMNTWCGSLKAFPSFRWFSYWMSGKTGQILTGRLNLFSGLLVWLAVYHKRAFTGKIHRHYKAPYKTRSEREAIISLPEYLVKGDRWFQQLRERLESIETKPATLIWGLKDPAFGPTFLRDWQKLLPEAQVAKLPKAGHFPQECEPVKVSRAIKDLLANQSA